jgi:hypothetical protein
MFEALFRLRLERDIKVSRALEANFVGPTSTAFQSEVERLTASHIAAHRTRLMESLEHEIFKQEKHLSDEKPRNVVLHFDPDPARKCSSRASGSTGLERSSHRSTLSRLSPMIRRQRLPPLAAIGVIPIQPTPSRFLASSRELEPQAAR